MLREAFRLNPFSAGGEPPSYEFYRFLSPVAFLGLLADALPPAMAAKEKPGLRTLRECLLDPGVPPAWLSHDLGSIVRYAWSRGIPVLLATYPPDRFTGREREADAAIRRVAVALGVPLADVSGELRRRWPAGVPDSFYASATSDRLNAAGLALVAEILLGDLERFHLAP